jgi:hypothetical protein
VAGRHLVVADLVHVVEARRLALDEQADAVDRDVVVDPFR